MKNLQSIIKKYSKLNHNQDNYDIGGGLSDHSFASRRHEDAKYDEGKLTLGKANQMFKKATGCDLDFVKSILKYAVPNMEWHHAGKLPKKYGGGMKKTYFLNSKEIVDIAENWNSYVEKYELHLAEQRKKEEAKRTREQLQQEFLNENAERVVRVGTRPEFFHETNREMDGKYGWFSSYGKSYNLPEYFTGWKFESKEKLEQFLSL